MLEKKDMACTGVSCMDVCEAGILHLIIEPELNLYKGLFLLIFVCTQSKYFFQT